MFLPTRVRRLFLFCALACVLWPAGARAQDEAPGDTPRIQLAELEMRFADAALVESDVAAIQREANTIRIASSACERTKLGEIEQLEANLLILSGSPSEESDGDAEDMTVREAMEVVDQRAEFEEKIRQLEIEISKCKLANLQAKELADKALARLSELSAQRLMSHGKPSLRALREDLGDIPLAVAQLAEHVIAAERLGRVGTTRLLIVISTTLLAFGIGWLLRNILRQWSSVQRGRGGAPALRAVLARTACTWLPIFLAGLTASTALTLYAPPPATDLILVRFCYGVTAIGIGAMLIDWITGPFSPGADLIGQGEAPTIVRTRAQALGVALVTGYTAFGRDWLMGPPAEDGLIVRALVTIFTAASLIWLVRGARQIPGMRDRLDLLRLVMLLAPVAAVIAELNGYRNLSSHLLLASVGTLLAGTALWTVLWVMRTAADGVVHGRSDISFRVRGWLGIRPEEASAELGWLRLILTLALWLSFAGFLVVLWDSTGRAMPKLRDITTQGFPIGGDMAIVPRDILVGFSVFGLIIALTAWVKARLSKRWLRDLGMDRGSREALVTLGGYVGFIIATVLGLTLSGVDFKGLAWVLTALSVGIGFGLQNIVNNFVSGLILLFERPIKSGDFVSVGEVEGVIRQIRIRSTEIETLDRRTVIVPNAELVSARVTNWVLHDPHGRLSLLVGVAYGSDTEKVKEILEGVAAAHSEVLNKGPAPKPRALFTGFGDSSLDFELRVWIRQIEKRFVVQSDLNFAIDQAFREADIEIPFPQRDLHMRSWSGDAQPDGGDETELPEHGPQPDDNDPD